MSSKWGIRYSSRDRTLLEDWHSFDFGETGTSSHLNGYLADVAPAIGWHWDYTAGVAPQGFAMPTDTFTFTAQYIAGGLARWRQFEAATVRDVADKVPGRLTIYREGVAAATNECYIVAAARSGYQWKADSMAVEYTVQPAARPWFTTGKAGTDGLGATVERGGLMAADLWLTFNNANGSAPMVDPYVTLTGSTTGWTNTYGLTGYTVPVGYIAVIDTRLHEVRVRDFENSNEWESIYQYRTPGIRGSGSYAFEQLPTTDGTFSITRSSAWGQYVGIYNNYGPVSLV